MSKKSFKVKISLFLVLIIALSTIFAQEVSAEEENRKSYYFSDNSYPSAELRRRIKRKLRRDKKSPAASKKDRESEAAAEEPNEKPKVRGGYKGLETMLKRYLAEKGIADEQIGLVYVKVSDHEKGIKGFRFNDQNAFIAASTIKLFAALETAELIDEGSIGWHDSVMYVPDLHLEYGSGVYAYSLVEGNVVEVKDLIADSLRLSDNVAHHMLVDYCGRHLGGWGLAKQVEKYALPYGNSVDQHFMRPADLIEGINTVYQKAKVSATYDYLLTALKNSVFTDYFNGLFPEVLSAHKTGSYAGTFSDYGIIYDDEPYYFALMTANLPDPLRTIQEIGLMVQQYHKDTIMPANAVYAETIDDIQAEMAELMSDVEVEMNNNPQLALTGHPKEFIKNSESYRNIINLGLKAVKPMYDILYESRDAGLYEYILAMAIQDITGEEFVYNADYGWKNSMEFRMAYEEKVNNVKFNVERIINDEKLSNEEKIEKFKEQGVFAVSFLIKEYNDDNSKIPKSVIEHSVKDIESKYEAQILSERSVADKSHIDINENKEVFDSLVELNGKAYK